MDKLNERTFDYTMMSTYQTCKRRFWYRFERGLTRKTPLTPVYFGQAIHQALDAWYIDKDIEKAVNIFKGAYTENLEVDDKRTHQMGEWILRNYDQQYRDQPWKLVESELAFKVDLPNKNSFIGRIDKIIAWNGILWVVDHKTTSSLGAKFFDIAEPNLQFQGYVCAARKLGYNCRGFVLDALLVAKGLLNSSQRSRLTPLARYDVYMDDETLKEWFKIVDAIQRDIRITRRANDWFPNYTMCTYYGQCPFRQVCKESQDVRERILESDYTVEHWNPTGLDTRDIQ